MLDFESRNVPASVALAGMIGLAKAAFEGLFGVLGIGGGGLIWSLITAFVGAVILIFLLRLIRRR